MLTAVSLLCLSTAAVSAPSTAALLGDLNDEITNLRNEVKDLRHEVSNFEKAGEKDDEPGEIRLFGVDTCPPGFQVRHLF